MWFGNIKCSVSLNGKKSAYFPVKQGVRQGGYLSPWLYLCYNNDISNILGATSYGITVNSTTGNSVLAAGDTTLISLTVQGLQMRIMLRSI